MNNANYFSCIIRITFLFAILDFYSHYLRSLVGMERFELSHLAVYAPEAYASASSATSPRFIMRIYEF